MFKPRGGGGTLYIWEGGTERCYNIYRRGVRGDGEVEMRVRVGRRRNNIDRDYDFALYFCHSDLI